MDILGYYVDSDGDKTVAADVFVAIEELGNGKISCYCPIGQHSEADKDYVEGCIEITKEEYVEASDRYYTPTDYL